MPKQVQTSLYYLNNFNCIHAGSSKELSDVSKKDLQEVKVQAMVRSSEIFSCNVLK